MPRSARRTVSLACLLGTAGCSSIVGTWTTVAVDPPTRPFPVSAITFDRDHNYTATWLREGEIRTGIGEYRWNGSKLKVMQADTLPRIFDTRLRGHRTLDLAYGKRDAKVTVTMTRAEERRRKH